MYFDIDDLDVARSYKLVTGTLVPRPIAWVVTLDEAGRCNAAPFSFFNAFGGHPPLICIGVGTPKTGRKDTLRHIQRQGEFVINMVSDALAEAMNLTAIDFPPGEDELAVAGLATTPSRKVKVPRILDSPVAMECTLQEVLPIDGGRHNMVVGRVVAMHVADEAVMNAERCYIDSERLDLIGRMQSPGVYTRTRDTFRIKQIGHEQWQEVVAGKAKPPERQ